jgi:hypothetical protein
MKRGPKPKEYCKHGHKLTTENTYQTYKHGVKNGRACRMCNRKLQKRYRSANPEVMYRSRMNSQNMLRYGLKEGERELILAAQGGKCSICGTSDCSWGKGFTKRWHVDHVHGTVNHRGILCSDCNLALGKLEPNISAVVEYLLNWN